MTFKVYGRNDCGYCSLTIKLLTKRNIPYEYISIRGNLKEYLDNFSGVTYNTRSIPLIFDDRNIFIGGYNELKELLEYSITNDF